MLEPRFTLAMAQQHKAAKPEDIHICARITSKRWVLRESMWMFLVIRMPVIRIHIPQYVVINRHANSHNPQLIPLYLARSKGFSYYNRFLSHVKLLQTIHELIHKLIHELKIIYYTFILYYYLLFFISIYFEFWFSQRRWELELNETKMIMITTSHCPRIFKQWLMIKLCNE